MYVFRPYGSQFHSLTSMTESSGISNRASIQSIRERSFSHRAILSQRQFSKNRIAWRTLWNSCRDFSELNPDIPRQAACRQQKTLNKSKHKALWQSFTISPFFHQKFDCKSGYTHLQTLPTTVSPYYETQSRDMVVATVSWIELTTMRYSYLYQNKISMIVRDFFTSTRNLDLYFFHFSQAHLVSPHQLITTRMHKRWDTSDGCWGMNHNLPESRRIIATRDGSRDPYNTSMSSEKEPRSFLNTCNLLVQYAYLHLYGSTSTKISCCFHTHATKRLIDQAHRNGIIAALCTLERWRNLRLRWVDRIGIIPPTLGMLYFLGVSGRPI